MSSKVIIKKRDVQKAIKKNDTLIEAADDLGISESTLLRLRKEYKMKLVR